MGPGMLVKHFNFVPNKILNIKEAFVVFPQGKGIVECVHGSLKTQLQNIKLRGLYPVTT